MTDKMEKFNRKLNEIIAKGWELKSEIKEKEAALEEELASKKKQLKKITVGLEKFINREEGGTPSRILPDGTARASAYYQDMYKMKNRQELVDEYILEGVPEKYAKLIRPKLDIFTNSMSSDVLKEHRKETGAEEVPKSTRLIGGDMIPGTGYWTKQEVRILKGDK